MKYVIGLKEYTEDEIRSLANKHIKMGIDSGAVTLVKEWDKKTASKSKKKKETD